MVYILIVEANVNIYLTLNENTLWKNKPWFLVKTYDGKYYIASKGMENIRQQNAIATGIPEAPASTKIDFLSSGLNECHYFKKGNSVSLR